MTSALVVCADDFALNPGVSQAIAALAEQGRISATSAMVCAPHWPTHAGLLQGCRGRLSVGLHLDLTSPWAVQSGHGMGLGRAMLHSLLGLTRRQHATQVIEQQLDRFEQVWQAPPEHIDGHQHVHQFPIWRDALVQVIQRRYPLGQRPWLRVSQPVAADRGFKTWIIGAMGASALAKAASQAQIPCARWLLGVSDFQGDATRWLDQAAQALAWAQGHEGVVLMCHPGGADPDPSDGIASARQQEWAALASPQWPALLQHHGVTLVARPAESVS